LVILNANIGIEESDMTRLGAILAKIIERLRMRRDPSAYGAKGLDL
jgi:hypothetical protein